MSGPTRVVFDPKAVIRDISHLQQVVEGNSDTLDIHLGLVTGISGEVDTINDTLDIHLGLVTGISGEVDTINDTLDIHLGLVTGISGEVDTINDTLDIHLGLVTGISGEVDTINDTLANKASMFNIDSLGNVNLLTKRVNVKLNLGFYGADGGGFAPEQELRLFEQPVSLTAQAVEPILVKIIRMKDLKFDKTFIASESDPVNYETYLPRDRYLWSTEFDIDINNNKNYFLRYLDSFWDGNINQLEVVENGPGKLDDETVANPALWPRDKNGKHLPNCTVTMDGNVILNVIEQTNPELYNLPFNDYYGRFALLQSDPSYTYSTWFIDPDANGGSAAIDSEVFPARIFFQPANFNKVEPNYVDPMIIAIGDLDISFVNFIKPTDTDISKSVEDYIDAVYLTDYPNNAKSVADNAILSYNKAFQNMFDIVKQELGMKTPNSLGTWGFSSDTVFLNNKTYFVTTVVLENVLIEYDNSNNNHKVFPLVMDLSNNGVDKECKLLIPGFGGRYKLFLDKDGITLNIYGNSLDFKNGYKLYGGESVKEVWQVTQVENNGDYTLPVVDLLTNNMFTNYNLELFTNNNVNFTTPITANTIDISGLNYNNEVWDIQSVNNNELIALIKKEYFSGYKKLAATDFAVRLYKLKNGIKSLTSNETTAIDNLYTKYVSIITGRWVNTTYNSYQKPDVIINLDLSFNSITDLSYIEILTNAGLTEFRANELGLTSIKKLNDNAMVKFNLTNNTFTESNGFNKSNFGPSVSESNGNGRGKFSIVETQEGIKWIHVVSRAGARDNFPSVYNIPYDFNNGEDFNACLPNIDGNTNPYINYTFFNSVQVPHGKNNSIIYTNNDVGFVSVKADFDSSYAPIDIIGTPGIPQKYYYSFLTNSAIVRDRLNLSDRFCGIFKQMSPYGQNLILDDFFDYNISNNSSCVLSIFDMSENKIVDNFWLMSKQFATTDLLGTDISVNIPIFYTNDIIESFAYDSINKKIIALPSSYLGGRNLSSALSSAAPYYLDNNNKYNVMKTQHQYTYYIAEYDVDLSAYTT